MQRYYLCLCQKYKHHYMRKIYNFAIVILLITTLFACKKNKDADASTELTGTWELSATQASMVPVTNYADGNGNLLVISATTYAYYANGQVVKQGTYATVEDATAEQNTCLAISEDTFNHRMVLDGDETRKVFFNIADGRLTFISGCFALDAGVKTVYRRIHNIDGIGAD